MRTFALALLAVMAPTVLAQPVLTDSSDTYVNPVLGFGYGGSGLGAVFAVGVEAGRRVSPSVDLGVHLSAGDLRWRDGGGFLTLGPTVGSTRSLGAGVELDARALGTATFADLGPLVDADGFGLRRLRGTGQVTLSTSYRVVGSLRLAPTLGAYASACRRVGVESPSSCSDAGALAGVDVQFRLFGADVSLPVVVPISLVGARDGGRFGVYDLPAAPISGGLRVRF